MAALDANRAGKTLFDIDSEVRDYLVRALRQR